MIPLRDHNQSDEIPVVTYIIIGINVLVFLYMSSLSAYDLNIFIYSYALVPKLVSSGENLPSFITSMFLHGGWMHLIGNMWFLYIFGDNIEAELGKFKYILFYLLCGFVGSFAQLILNADSIVPNLGASGAIAGVLGAYIVFFPNAKVEVLVPLGFYARVMVMPAYFMLGYWILIQVFFGLGSLPSAQADVGGVAYFAHIGGFGGGYLLARGVRMRG